MTAEEERLLRAAIREAFEYHDWEGDLAFGVLGRESAEGDINEASDVAPFQVWVSDDGIVNVGIPAAWTTEPYFKQVLQSMAAQELKAHLGIQSD